MVEFVLITAGIAMLHLQIAPSRPAFVTCVCLFLGLQNGILGKLGSVAIHSTYITGMSTSLVGAVFGNRRASRSVLSRIIGLFVLGAFCGAVSAHDLDAAGFALILAFLAVACASAFLRTERAPPAPA